MMQRGLRACLPVVLALCWTSLIVRPAVAQPDSLQTTASQGLSDVRERAPVDIAQDASRDEILAELDTLLATMAVHGTSRDAALLSEIARFRRAVALAGAAPVGCNMLFCILFRFEQTNTLSGKSAGHGVMAA